MIAKINLLRKEKALLHADTEICNSFYLFSTLRVNFKLWDPERVYELF